MFNWEIVSENGQQDSSINHNERVWLEFKVQNTDLINGLDSLQISQASFSSPIPPGDTISDPSFVLALTATSQGDSATLPYRLGYDHHLDIQSARFPVTAWNPDPIWGDTLDVFSIVGETTNLFPIVADPPLLTGHEYLINFFENSQTGELLWRLIDQTTGAVKLDSAGVSNDPLFPHPVMDGIQWQAHEIIPDFKNFQCIANAAGPLDPPESAAAKFAGFPVSANPGDRQQVGDGRWL
ncbi:MAG: hypothetical protein GWN10_25190, partial [Nitrospinaceae bacterium]|nr:hypothetical protein [Nitrospinaceae bacterium]NIX37346.1 hypothetical protein [Nitrospinaceae bacterium]